MSSSIFPAVRVTAWSCQVSFTSGLTTAHVPDMPMTYPSHPSLLESHQSKAQSKLRTVTASSFANKVGKLRTEAIPSMPATTRYPESALWQASQSTASNGAVIVDLSDTNRVPGR